MALQERLLILLFCRSSGGKNALRKQFGNHGGGIPCSSLRIRTAPPSRLPITDSNRHSNALLAAEGESFPNIIAFFSFRSPLKGTYATKPIPHTDRSTLFKRQQIRRLSSIDTILSCSGGSPFVCR
ncbi:hypothetical protein BDN72DRAFT_677719 [Pluteus cervinus]|uniref:Uncharacterized protein n=1 Tax=Pluteus cervinus TaxID=181527 RepID=A0ACD3A0A8_9AGAR|nr:hypothetical protein BDN72DRAFT_677719 [Pluteus cervinus]